MDPRGGVFVRVQPHRRERDMRVALPLAVAVAKSRVSSSREFDAVQLAYL